MCWRLVTLHGPTLLVNDVTRVITRMSSGGGAKPLFGELQIHRS